MARMRRRSRPRPRRRGRLLLAPGLVVVVAAGAWYFWPRPQTQQASPQPAAGELETTPIAVAPSGHDPRPILPRPQAVAEIAQRSEPAGQPAPSETAPSKAEPAADAAPATAAGHRVEPEPSAEPASGPDEAQLADGGGDASGTARLASDAALDAGDLIALRSALNRKLTATHDAAEARRLRKRLERLAERTIFSREVFENDPLVEVYTVQPGETLVAIAKRYKVSPEIIMRINGIRDARRLRAGQRIKVPHGPFHVRIDKSDFRLDLYLQDLFVRSFKVGLGSDGGTPTGVWKVKNRLKNPTYFPPPSAPEKRVIPADDPANPLGEFWIGLEGISGEALGQEGYGIHGTIEPDSIGKNVSLGCVRMHNKDVEFVFACVRPGESTVTIVP